MNHLTQAVLKFGRLTHFHEHVDREDKELVEFGCENWEYVFDDIVKPPVRNVDDGANVVSSLLTNGKHAPAIDLDVPAILVPSSTPGHSHLYIDHELSWKDYLRVLRVLTDVRIVELGILQAAERRGTTLLRLPHVKKPKV